MAVNMFLQLDGIPGTTADPDHPGAIDVLAYSWGLSHNPPVGTTHPKANLQDFSLTIFEDAYSPLLFRACVLGSVIKNASLQVVKAGSDTPKVANTSFQFTGVRVTSLSAGGSGGEDRLPEAISAIRGSGGDSLVLVELLQGPEQRAVLDRLLALTTLLEGHADHVMDAAGPEVVPSVETIRARFTLRRRGGGLVDRLLRALLGVEAKVKQYAVGSAFTKYVVLAAGMDGFNRVWESPETLPTRAELADPAAWLERVG